MFENNIKACREELEMTQKELGFVFGLSDSSIRAWENGYDIIPFNKLLRFCNLYDYSLDYVVGFTRKNIKYGNFKTDKIIIGKNLKNLRNQLKLSQQKIADECKVPRSTYSGYENGSYLVNTINMYVICKTYNVSMDWLVGRTDNPNINKSNI